MTARAPSRAGAARLVPSRRLLLLVPAFAALVTATLGGLIRLGWVGAPTPSSAVVFHGSLLVGGFFGTLIALERAVALGRWWAYLAPVLSGTGAALILAGAPWAFASGLLAAGAAVFVAASVAVLRIQPVNFTFILLLGAISLLVGNVLALQGRPVFELVPWWIFFLVLTICGERLELSRMVQVSPGSRRFFDVVLLLIPAAGGLALFAPDTGMRMIGLLFLTTAVWLALNDAARRTIRMKGLPRYIAWCLFAGYFWLAVAGVLLLWNGRLLPGFLYDAALHAVFLGFAFSMVFGHAPVIFPAVVRLPVEYRPSAYVHLVVLHASLLLRVSADLVGNFEVRLWAGLGNGLALALFFGSVITSVVRHLRRRRGKPAEERAVGHVAAASS